ncbi:unnamed protein product [Urochloa humidicola]
MEQTLYFGQTDGSMVRALQTWHLVYWSLSLSGDVRGELCKKLSATISGYQIFRETSPVGVFTDYLRLWDILYRHIWRLAANGQYSAKSAYEGFFLESTVFRPWEKNLEDLGTGQMLFLYVASCP